MKKLAYAVCLPVLVLIPIAARADLSKILPKDAEVKKVVGDCRFTEGPAWSPKGFLVFSDIPNNRIIQVLPNGTSKDFVKPSGHANGLVFDAAGTLYACRGAGEGGARSVARIDPKSKKVTELATKWNGKRFNSPNDLALDDHGGIYFTDPRYGGEAGREIDIMAVYYLSAAGKVTRIIENQKRPNGILVSPDGKILYVAEPNSRELYSYEITAPGKISKGQLIFVGDKELDGGGPDGMALDASGNIYATYKGITVLDPKGRLLGRIAVAENPSNCIFGGKDGKTLYITARTSLYSVDLLAKGTALRKPVKASDVSASGAAKAEKVGVLTMKVPVDWKRGRPTSRMRKAQFTVPKVEGDEADGELVIYYFGPNDGGGVLANVQRWIGQFDPNDRKVKVFRGEAQGGEYTIVDATGTYNKPIGPPIQGRKKPTPGSRMLAVILPTSEGHYFLKFTGPQKTISAAAKPFRRSFGGDASKEKELE
jgi:gluconolactonase